MRTLKIGLFYAVASTILLIGLQTQPIALQNALVEKPTWNPSGAAKYLDERMDAWFASPITKLRTGSGETTCVSCHTTVPYVLARPALRRVMNVQNETAQEFQIVEEVRRRVETYGTHEVPYALNAEKIRDSLGTEAVLNFLILANADFWQRRQDPSASTEKALEQLWKTQEIDGSWEWFDFGLEPFEAIDARYYGASLAALAIGTAPGVFERETTATRIGIDRLGSYLQETYGQQNLFNRVHALLASTRFKDLLKPSNRELLIEDLRRKQRHDGGWSLDTLGPWRWNETAPPFKAPGTLNKSLLNESDGYATGLIVYALLEADISVHDPLMKNGLAWLRVNQGSVQIDQHTWTAWRAYSVNFDREHGGERGETLRRLFMSDSATAFATLALIGEREQFLGR